MLIWRVVRTVFLSTVVLARNPYTPGFLKNVRRTAGGIHVPVHRNELPSGLRKRGHSSAIGLGDVQDITYNVLVQIGQIETPLVLDTGSADIWVINDQCDNCNASRVTTYPQSSFQDSGLNIDLLYGDSQTGTHAAGSIGKDSAGIAGMVLNDQFFASINDTNTSITESGSAGIFGLGFPAISPIWRNLISLELANEYPGKREPPEQSSAPLRRRQNSTTPVSYPEVFASFATYGPLIARMVAQNFLTLPMVTITLQRDTVDIGGNMGMLSIGELPEGVKNESITWVPITTYSVVQGGLAPPPDALTEKYPLVWEVLLDGIYIDGELLPRSTLVPEGIGLYGLIDTGNSLIRGQQDLVESITKTIGGDKFSCSTPHNLSFQIGGKLFPVDPRDLIQQSYPDSLDWCQAKLGVTDPPGSPLLHSWSLGDPFLKSTLVSFYYGNLVYPSRDPPRIGFLSTVPSNADALLKQALDGATGNETNLPLSSEPAPSGKFAVLTTGIGGVPQATHTGLPVVETVSSAARVLTCSIFYTTTTALGLRLL